MYAREALHDESWQTRQQGRITLLIKIRRPPTQTLKKLYSNAPVCVMCDFVERKCLHGGIILAMADHTHHTSIKKLKNLFWTPVVYSIFLKYSFIRKEHKNVRIRARVRVRDVYNLKGTNQACKQQFDPNI